MNKRLTIKDDDQYILIGTYATNVEEFKYNHKLRNELLNKVGELEDSEEEFGIDLITLFKALKNGIWVVKSYCPLQFSQRVEIYDIYCFRCFIKDYDNPIEQSDYVNFKDYGKTWALTREELEK